MRQSVTLTPAAVQQIRRLTEGQPGTAGLRLAVVTKGCSGLSYQFARAEAAMPGDEVVTSDGAVVFVEGKALLFVLGTEIDWVEDGLQSQFVFRNPNEVGRCGCGQSFLVDCKK